MIFAEELNCCHGTYFLFMDKFVQKTDVFCETIWFITESVWNYKKASVDEI